MKIILIWLMLSFPAILLAQNIYGLDQSETILPPKDINETQIDFLLFVHSSHRCGYCRLLRHDLATQNLPKNLRVVFMEYDTPVDWILEADSTYLGFEVRRVKTDRNERKVKIFPTSQLVKAGDSSMVKRYKGYPFDMWEDVEKRCDR